MTDLIQQLHHYANGECYMTPVGSTLLEAADLIEQLVKERDYTEGTNDTFIALNQVLEAKLAKAVGMLKTMADYNKYVIAPFLAELGGKE